MFKIKTKTGAAFRQALEKSNFGSFKKAVEEVYEDGGGTVDIMKTVSINDIAGRQTTVDITEVIGDPDFQGTVKNDWKDGLFVFQIYDKNTKHHSDHYFALGKIETPRARRTARKDGDEEGNGGKRAKEGSVAAAMEKWMEIDAARAERQEARDERRHEREQAEAQRRHDREQTDAQRRHDRDMEEIKQRYSNQGSGSGLSEGFEILSQGISIGQQMNPQIQQEDTLTTLATLASPIIQGLFTRGRQGQQFPQQQFTQQQIDDYMRAQAAKAAAGTPAPGQLLGTDAAPAPGATLGDPGGNGRNAPQAPVLPEPGSIEYFQQQYFDPFRRYAAVDAPDEELAYQIINMINYALDRMPGNPPAILIDFIVAQTLMDYEAALAKFFAAIPELANLKQRQAGIRAVLVTKLGPGATEAPPEVAQEEIKQMSPEQTEAEQPTVEEQIEVAYEQNAAEAEESSEYSDAEEEAESVHDADSVIVREAVTEEGTTEQDHSDGPVVSAGVEDETV